MSNIRLFNDARIRVSWNDQEEEWYFSVVDVVAVLTESLDPKQYLKKIRNRDQELNSKWGTICTPVESTGKDGKKRKVLMGNTKGILRLIQSIPSQKAEPFKIWLAQVGSERLDEIEDPEKAFDRGIKYYRQKGYSEEWIKQRIISIDVRRELTDEFKIAGITDSKEYAILTNELTRSWSGMSIKEYKEIKGLKKEGLRDNMSNLELTLNMLAEVSTAELCKVNKPIGFDETMNNVKSGGEIAGNAKKEIEKKLGKKITTTNNRGHKKKIKTSNN